MTASARQWLGARIADVPASLAARMTRAVDDVAPDDAGSIADTLAEAALLCLRDAMPRCDDREAALQLLAADALMTSACEAAAELKDDGQAIDHICSRFTATRLAAELEVR